MPTDIEELTRNLRENNREVVAAIVLLTSLLQKVAAKLGDNEIKDAVDTVKDHIKKTELPRKFPPGCRLKRFDELPAELQAILGAGWRDFFNQPVPNQPVPDQPVP